MYASRKDEPGEFSSQILQSKEGSAEDKLERETMEKFLSKFTVSSDASSLDHLNLILMLKAIPL